MMQHSSFPTPPTSGSLGSNETKAGDFTGLGSDYAQYRPDYAQSALRALLGLLDKPVSAIDFVDVGAGTGIWTRMVEASGVRSATAVEPNDDMRENGIASSKNSRISFRNGSAEKTGLADGCADFVSMASSFHWADFDGATREFHRILRPAGRFAALWNPRMIELNPMLLEIENYLNTLRPNIKRVSSGRSGITDTLSQKLWDSPYFDDVVYIEARHTISMSRERYLGVWRSVNDLRSQLGNELFAQFMIFVDQRTAQCDHIDATYLTRAWSARRRD